MSVNTPFQGKRPKRCRDKICRAAPYDCNTCPGPEEGQRLRGKKPINWNKPGATKELLKRYGPG